MNIILHACHTDEDMTTLDMTKNIAKMHICEVISNANHAIIYLRYPGQKYFTDFCAMSNSRCMGHLYNPHMKIREKEKIVSHQLGVSTGHEDAH